MRDNKNDIWFHRINSNDMKLCYHQQHQCLCILIIILHFWSEHLSNNKSCFIVEPFTLSFLKKIINATWTCSVCFNTNIFFNFCKSRNNKNYFHSHMKSNFNYTWPSNKMSILTNSIGIFISNVPNTWSVDISSYFCFKPTD